MKYSDVFQISRIYNENWSNKIDKIREVKLKNWYMFRRKITGLYLFKVFGSW